MGTKNSKLNFCHRHADANSLTGSIPFVFGFLSNLGHLLLNGNELTGTIPSEFASLTNLRVLLLDSNSFVGNADVVCTADKGKIDTFVMDCSGDKPEIQCSCCTLCCADSNPTCNAYDWQLNVDPVWEYTFQRGRYAYNLGPEVYVVPNAEVASSPLP